MGFVRIALALNQSDRRINLHDFTQADTNLRHKQTEIFILNGYGQVFQEYPILKKSP